MCVLVFLSVLFFFFFLVIYKSSPRDKCYELALAISTMVHAWDDGYFSFICLVYLSLTNKTLNKYILKKCLYLKNIYNINDCHIMLIIYTFKYFQNIYCTCVCIHIYTVHARYVNTNFFVLDEINRLTALILIF